MSAHDIIEYGVRDGLHFVSCGCGWVQSRTTEGLIREAHLRHVDLVTRIPELRAALEGGRDGS
jgi:hypothetical protein